MCHPPFPSTIGIHAPRNTFGEAIFAGFTTGASIVISGNYVTNCSRNQIEVLDNYLGANGQGSVLIEGNTVITPEDGIANASPFCPNGITAGWVFNPPATNDPTKNPKYTISHNYVENKSTRQGHGIVVLSDGAVIQKNEIVVTGNSTNPGGANGLPLNIGISISIGSLLYRAEQNNRRRAVRDVVVYCTWSIPNCQQQCLRWK